MTKRGSIRTREVAKVGQFGLRDDKDVAKRLAPYTHIYHGGARCSTDTRGYPTPENRSPLDLVLDSTNGFIPLWDRDVTLRFRFQEQSLATFLDPDAIKSYVRKLFAEALLAWGHAAPVGFKEVRDLWDFEIVVREEDSCSPMGCTLARAFFPDAGRHELVLFPRVFAQSRKEQIETMAHELGHVFGLRHFFAQLKETAFPSVIFGDHSQFSIMNYGDESALTDNDRNDLSRLYAEVWSGRLTRINGTKIIMMRPFSYYQHLGLPQPDQPAWVRTASTGTACCG